MKTKRKLLLFIFIVLLLGIVYVIVFSKPLIKVEEISVINAHERGLSCDMTDDDMKDTVWTLYDDAEDMSDHQQIWQGEKPSNENIDDYIIINYKLKATNFSVFDSYCDYLLINDCDNSKKFFITEWPNTSSYILKRFSTQNDDEFLLEIWAYKKDISEKELDNLIHSVQIQAALSNKLHKNYSLLINSEKAEIKYID